MIRTAARKAVLLSAVALLMGTVAVNCSGTNKQKGTESSAGSAGIALTLSPGIVVNSVSYTITGNGIAPITGTINVTDPSATVSVLVNGIPAGNNYLVQLSATSVDGKTMCGGSANFNVVAGSTTNIPTIILQCHAPKTAGSATINGAIDNCPSLTSFSASPLTVSVSTGTINVGSSAIDLDGQPITFAWTATSGTFGSASSASTTYKCTLSGPQTLTITVSDGVCGDSATIPVTCATAAVCGNGVIEAGETCDPPNGATCDGLCHTIIPGTGGAGTGGAGTGGAGTGGAGTGGAGTGGAGTGGAGTGGAGTGGAGTGGAGTGGNNGMACTTCETAQCDSSFQGCTTLAAGSPDRALCDNLVACIRMTHCSKNGDAQACWCGTATDIQCLSGMANGPCKAQEEAAAKTGSTDPGTVAGTTAQNFVDPGFPIGLANNLIQCDNDSCKNVCSL